MAGTASVIAASAEATCPQPKTSLLLDKRQYVSDFGPDYCDSLMAIAHFRLSAQTALMSKESAGMPKELPRWS